MGYPIDRQPNSSGNGQMPDTSSSGHRRRRVSGDRRRSVLRIASIALLSVSIAAGCSGGANTAADSGGGDSAAAGGDATGVDARSDGFSKTIVHVDDRGDGKRGSGTAADPYRDLQVAIDRAPAGAQLQVAAGTYRASAKSYADPTCGNCSAGDFAGGAQATRGFFVSRSLHLVGAGAGKTTLVTNAGYGVLFHRAGKSSIRDLTVTGGKRDADGKATDAGIVVRHTELVVQRVHVVKNDDRYTGPQKDPIVGVGGIFAREGAKITVLDSVIEDNSWDGIALYRGEPGRDNGPKATVRNTRIGCTSQCIYKRGRGAGIGATWDSELLAEGNVIHHYWKGIGSFGTAEVVVRNNVVRDQHGWGIVATAHSNMRAENNVVIRSGTTGMAAWSSTARGAFINNIVVKNGVAATEWVGKKTGVWFNADAKNFELRYNLIQGNTPRDVCRGGTPGKLECKPLTFVGANGNISKPPKFRSDSDFQLASGSPAIDAGDPKLKDRDGSRSDIGVFGGPKAPSELP